MSHHCRLRLRLVSRNSQPQTSWMPRTRGNANLLNPSSHLAGVDGRITLDPNTVVTFQLLGRRSDTGSGPGFFAEWRRSGPHLNVTPATPAISTAARCL
jgi:hypothetical protein